MQREFERQAKDLLVPLYRMALRLTRQRAEAEDLVQDTVVKAYQAYRRIHFDGAAGVRAWMFTILANTFRDGYRRRARSPEVSLAFSENEQESNVIELVASQERGPASEVESKRFCEAAQAVIDRMAPEVRLAVTLFFVEGYTYEEIADISQCPVGTVMSRLWKARRVLREQLAHFTDEHGDAATSTRGGASRRLKGDLS